MFENDISFCANAKCNRVDCKRQNPPEPGIYSFCLFCPNNDFENCEDYLPKDLTN